MNKARIKKRLSALMITLLTFLTCLSPSAWALPSGKLIRVAVCGNNPYYSYETGNGELNGLEIEIMDRVAHEMGYDGVEYIRKEDIHACMSALSDNEVQAILGFPSFFDGDLSEVSLSSEIITMNLCLMAKNDGLDLLDEANAGKLTVVFEHNTNNYAIVANLGAALYYVMPSQEQVLDTVLAGKADAMICDGDCMAVLLEHRGLEGQFSVVRNNISTVGHTIAVRKSDSWLLRDINQAILKIHISGEYDTILGRWIRPKKEVDVEKLVKWSIAAVAAVSVGVLIYAFLNWRLRSILKRRVEEVTEELEKNLEKLQYESDLRNQIIESSASLMLICDRVGRLMMMNRAAKKLVNDPEEHDTEESVFMLPVIGFLLRSILQADGDPALHSVDNVIAPYQEDGQGKRIFRCSIANVKIDDSQDGFLIIASDVTIEENRKQELVEKEKSTALSRLIAGIAHEIKNPLAGIQNFVDLVRTERDNPQFWDYFNEYVPKEIKRISSLIENLMDYSRPSKGTKMQSELAPIIRECSVLLATAARNKDIVLTTEVQEGIWIYAVRDQIKQVLINIMLNSVEAFHGRTGGKQIILRAVNENGRVTISVEDNGEGMSAEAISNCMDPFYTTKDHGTGLGLAISRQFVQENGGKMQIESIMNKGTKITLTFDEGQYEKQNSDS